MRQRFKEDRFLPGDGPNATTYCKTLKEEENLKGKIEKMDIAVSQAALNPVCAVVAGEGAVFIAHRERTVTDKDIGGLRIRIEVWDGSTCERLATTLRLFWFCAKRQVELRQQ